MSRDVGPRFAWPRLWLILPENTQSEIRSADSAFASAVVTASWAWPYLALAVLCWRRAIIAAAVILTGWLRARIAVADLGTLTESAIDLHGRTLAVELGVAQPESKGPLTMPEGE